MQKLVVAVVVVVVVVIVVVVVVVVAKAVVGSICIIIISSSSGGGSSSSSRSSSSSNNKLNLERVDLCVLNTSIHVVVEFLTRNCAQLIRTLPTVPSFEVKCGFSSSTAFLKITQFMQ
jgi:hypothetical protein